MNDLFHVTAKLGNRNRVFIVKGDSAEEVGSRFRALAMQERAEGEPLVDENTITIAPLEFETYPIFTVNSITMTEV